MRFSVLCEKLYDLGIDLVAVLLAGGDSHSDTAKGLKRALERLVRLKTDYLLKVFIKITCIVRGYGGYYLCIHIQHAACCSFLLAQVHYLRPELLCCVCRSFKKALVAFI